MRTISHVLLILTLLCFALYSCKKQFDDNAISQSLKNKLIAHCFSTDLVEKTADGYVVENDLMITEEFLDQSPPVQTLRIGNVEQFQTTYTLSGLPRTIGINLSSQLPANYSTALDEAIGRYNDENLLVHFQRAGSAAAINIVNTVGIHLAISGFPTPDGNPYNTIKLNSALIGNNNTGEFIHYLATIICHELGHCIGFRHTDYLDRSFSCGGRATRESCGSAGAVMIPGTSSSPQAASWMLTCISPFENRPFTAGDKIALHYLY